MSGHGYLRVSTALRALGGRWCLTLLVAASYGCAAAPVKTKHSSASEVLPRGAVARLELEVSALGRTGLAAETTLISDLWGASLVCLGEQHDNLVHHALQRRLVETLVLRANAESRPVALGFEMFQLPAQPALDAFARGDIEEADLLAQSEYTRRWGFDFEYYRDALTFTKTHDGKLLALNAPREWTKAVAKRGTGALAQMNASISAADLVLNDPDHQQFFGAAMGAFHDGAHDPASSHGAAHAAIDWSKQPFYAAQVVWDETMAQTAAGWIDAAPKGLIIVLAGAGHCHRSAIPRRFERRHSDLRALGVQLRERSSMAEPSIPAASTFDWVVIAEGR